MAKRRLAAAVSYYIYLYLYIYAYICRKLDGLDTPGSRRVNEALRGHAHTHTHTHTHTTHTHTQHTHTTHTHNTHTHNTHTRPVKIWIRCVSFSSMKNSSSITHLLNHWRLRSDPSLIINNNKINNSFSDRWLLRTDVIDTDRLLLDNDR